MTEFTHLNDIVVQGSVSSSEQGSMIGSVKTMPPASALNKDQIVLYSGETNGTYTKGMYYMSNGSKWTLSDAPLYSTNDYTSSDKAKLEGIADGAQVNVIETVKVNGATQAVVNKAVNISVPTSYGFKLQVDTATGVISLLDKQGVVLSTINTTINRVIKSGYYDTASGNIVLVTDDNTQINIPVSDLVDTYVADGTYLTLDERTFSLSSSAKAAVDAVANKADDSAVVHTTGNESIAGDKTFRSQVLINGDWNNLTLIHPKADSDNPPSDLWLYKKVIFLDKNNNRMGELVNTLDTDGSHLMSLRAWFENSAKYTNGYTDLGVRRYTDGTAYGMCPSWKVGTADNSDTILTTKMANSLPSLVHTTGNEEIAGNKTFSTIPYVTCNRPFLYCRAMGTEIGVVGTQDAGVRFGDKNDDATGGVYNSLSSDGKTTNILVRAINKKEDGSYIMSTVAMTSKSDGTTYATAPSTKDTHPNTAIVTKDYLQSTIEQASLSKQPYVVAFDPAVAVTNATTCIKYQGHCASYTKPVMSDNVLNRGSWTDDEYLLKRMQYCTFRPDGTIKEVLYKNDLTKVWIKNYADGTPDTPIYANGELMEYCATQTQPSEIPSDATESSITTLDTMLVIPTLYTYGDERGFRVSYDPSQGSAEAHTLDGHVYKYEAIGVYLASNSSDGTTIMSVSDAEPLRNTTRYAFRGKLVTKDQTNGKWKLFNYYDSRMFKLLAYLIGGSLDSQATFGVGLSSGSMGINASGETEVWRRNLATYTGKTNTVGMFGQSFAFTQKFDADKYGVYDNGNTTQVRQVKFLIEAPWSQCWQFTDDTCDVPSTGRFYAGTNSASVIQQTDTSAGAFFTAQVTNPTLMKPIFTFYDPTDGLPGFATNVYGYSSMLRTENEAWGMPVNTKGSSNTGTCDSFSLSNRSKEGVYNSVIGAAATSGSNGGVAHWIGVDPLTHSNISVGARTCFLFD